MPTSVNLNRHTVFRIKAQAGCLFLLNKLLQHNILLQRDLQLNSLPRILGRKMTEQNSCRTLLDQNLIWARSRQGKNTRHTEATNQKAEADPNSYVDSILMYKFVK